MSIIGRQKEQDLLEQCENSGKPEFMVVYGRRRVGKTFLIKEYFKNTFSFYATALNEGNMRSQLKAFNESLKEYGDKHTSAPKDWFEAFSRLRALLENDDVYKEPRFGRRIIFLDEVPWMDTPRSDFKSALDYFWNSWASSQNNLLLIVCGSATSWIINNILFNTGGFYNRITRQLYLDPFTLKECEEFYSANGIKMNRTQIIESYMVFGGIPYYMNLLNREMSLVQNIDSLVMNQRGQLHYEYDRLFISLFKNPALHIQIIAALADRQEGLLRTELISDYNTSEGEGLTKALNELEQCGFIRKYKNYTKSKRSFIYQLIDPFVLFSHTFLNEKNIDSWESFYKTPAYYNWRGNAFEMLCLYHTPQIKTALGISGLSSTEYAWKSNKNKEGAQIDLLIDRKDDIINLCEMKYTDDPFIVSSQYQKAMIHKESVFKEETVCKKAIFLTLVSANGLSRNENSDVFQNTISGDDLFT
ncbi:MAG: ATP-binding protein [Clostridiales bacterium]|nr:ATP-binding protein [Clostridiales bacterium]